MLKETLKTLYRRDLEKLRKEIDSYKTEENLWLIEKGLTNSAGNLCLHLIGNLSHFVGAELGKSGYVRQRDLEFSNKHIPKKELLQMIDETISTIEQTIDSLTDADFAADYPQIVFTDKMKTGYFLTHLATHLNYHLGQINYHRRLLDE